MNAYKLLKTLLMLGVALTLAGAPAFAIPTLSTDYRYGAQFDEWFVRGDADVGASPAFTNGVRLAAWDGQDENDLSRLAVASAVYFFDIPAGANSVAIEIGYKSAGPALGNQVAGLLFVRDLEIERRFASQIEPDTTPLEEPTFYGNTYLLPGDQVSLIVELPVENHVVNGVFELHLSASAGEVLDVQYVQLTARGTESPVYVTAAPSITYVRDPYQYSYAYYYMGPWLYPCDGYFASFDLFDNDIDPFFWGGWPVYRSCFYSYHPWIYRPHHYAHVVVFNYFPTYINNITINNYRCEWYQAHYRVDIRHRTDNDIDRDFRHRRILADADRASEFRSRLREVAENVRDSNREVRDNLGNRWRDRIEAWREDPALGRRELSRWGKPAETLQKAVAAWRAAPVEERREAVQSTIADLRERATEKLQALRERRERDTTATTTATSDKPTAPSLAERLVAARRERAAQNAPAWFQRNAGQQTDRTENASLSGRNDWRSGGGLLNRGNRANSGSADRTPGTDTPNVEAPSTGHSPLLSAIREPREQGSLLQRWTESRRQDAPTPSSEPTTTRSTQNGPSWGERIDAFRQQRAARLTAPGPAQAPAASPEPAATAPLAFTNSPSASGNNPVVLSRRSGQNEDWRSRIQAFREQRASSEAARAPESSAPATQPAVAPVFRFSSRGGESSSSNPVVIPSRTGRAGGWDQLRDRLSERFSAPAAALQPNSNGSSDDDSPATNAGSERQTFRTRRGR